MPRLTRQSHFRSLQNLPFCYLCGQPIDPRTATRDHAPAQAIFAEADRTPPLILPTHAACNNARSDDDNRISQLVRMIHRKGSPQDLSRWKFSVGRVENVKIPMALVQGPDLRPLVWRWVAACHAALYGQHIPTGHGTWQLHLPLPEGTRQKDGKVRTRKTPVMYPTIIEELKRNFLADQFDQILCYNGKCDYRCVWVTADGGEWVCMFGLRLYNWENLGARQMGGGRRGCVGVYQSSHGYPEGASRGTNLILDLPRAFPLDPFSVLAS
jgi:hypothetical protein